MTLEDVIKAAVQRKQVRRALQAMPRNLHPRRLKLIKQLGGFDRKITQQAAALQRAGVAQEEIQAELEKRGLR
jgi:hypothetical protein